MRTVKRAGSPAPATVRSEGTSLTLKKAGLSAARVGDDIITLHELDVAVRKYLRDKGMPAGQSPTRDELNMIGRSVLDMLIERSLIVHEARIKLKNPKQIDMFMEMADKAFREEELPHLLRQERRGRRAGPEAEAGPAGGVARRDARVVPARLPRPRVPRAGAAHADDRRAARPRDARRTTTST